MADERPRPSVRNYSLDLTRQRKVTETAVSPSSCSVKFMPEVADNPTNPSARKHSSLSQPALRCHSKQHHNILSPHALASLPSILTTMNSSVPMIDLTSSSGDDDDPEVAMMRSYLPVPQIRRSSDDVPDSPPILYSNGNIFRSTLSMNPPPLAPSPFSEITVSSQRPLVARSSSNASEHNLAMKEAAKKAKPVADIAHLHSSYVPQSVTIQNLPLIPSYLSLQEEPFGCVVTTSATSSAIQKSSSTGAMPRRPPLLRLAPVPEDEEDDEVFEAEKSDDKQRFLPPSKKQRRLHGSLHSEDANNSDEEDENKEAMAKKNRKKEAEKGKPEEKEKKKKEHI
ncbi:unnamed protein product [Caenorhabditis sp. 36 PRJEB53466]|nr:unnamed protein product [Caenorhabditis sp. 36 PRJEB53466]